MENNGNQKQNSPHIQRWDMNDEQWNNEVKDSQAFTTSEPPQTSETIDEEVPLTKSFKASLAFLAVTVISSLLLYTISKNESLLIAITWMTLGTIWLIPFIFGVGTIIAFVIEFIKYSKSE